MVSGTITDQSGRTLTGPFGEIVANSFVPKVAQS